MVLPNFLNVWKMNKMDEKVRYFILVAIDFFYQKKKKYKNYFRDDSILIQRKKKLTISHIFSYS